MATSRTPARPRTAGDASSSPAEKAPAKKRAITKQAPAATGATATKKPASAKAAGAANKSTATKKPAATPSTASKTATAKAPAARKATARKAAALTRAVTKVPSKRTVASVTPAAKKTVAASKAAVGKKAAAARKAPAGKTAAAPRKAPAGKRRSRAQGDGSADAAARLQQVVRGALEDLKARDVTEIDVQGKSSVTDLLVIASGTSSRHVKSIADEVIKKAKQAGVPPIGVEGQREAEWVLVDLGDVVVHVMQPRTREFYGLERLWGLGGDEDESEAAAATLAG